MVRHLSTKCMLFRFLASARGCAQEAAVGHVRQIRRFSGIDCQSVPVRLGLGESSISTENDLTRVTLANKNLYTCHVSMVHSLSLCQSRMVTKIIDIGLNWAWNAQRRPRFVVSSPLSEDRITKPPITASSNNWVAAKRVTLLHEHRTVNPQCLHERVQ